MRQPTPNVLDALMPERSETFAIRQALLWNYDQLGDAAETVITHAVEIKRHERRANESVIEAGRHLIAVKESLTHGQWGDWLATEFSMTDRTARTLISIAERFDGKSEIISDLNATVLGLLAAPSVPEAAVAAVIDASAQGAVSVATAKTIIQQHKPAKLARTYASGLPALNMPAPTTTAPTVVAADDTPLPAWATEPEPLTAADLTVMQPAPNLQSPISQSPDPRIAHAQRLIDLYRQAIDASQEYGDLTGHHTETLPLERCAEKLISRLQRMVDMLTGKSVPPIEEEETWG
jgi:hypothetical protein